MCRSIANSKPIPDEIDEVITQKTQRNRLGGGWRYDHLMLEKGPGQTMVRPGIERDQEYYGN